MKTIKPTKAEVGAMFESGLNCSQCVLGQLADELGYAYYDKEIVTEIAKKYDIETEIVGPVFDSPLSDTESYAFKTVENAIARIFPDVITAPYIMTGASDSRYFSRVCDNCIRFSPFTINNEQLDSVHAVNENLDLNCLAPAVDFYRLIITEA